MGSGVAAAVEEPEGFAEFVAARSRDLLRFAWLLCGDWSTAEDLVQTALAKTWGHWQHIDHADPSRYVRRVIVTTRISGLRRRWRGEVPTARLPEAPQPGDAFRTADERQALIAALAELPPRQRAVIVLRYFEDLPESDTAAAMGCTVGTVKSQTAKALAALRRVPSLAGTAEIEEVAP